MRSKRRAPRRELDAPGGWDDRDVDLDRIRDLVAERIDYTSLRSVAREIGMSPMGVSGFVAGASPYRKTLRRLLTWHASLSGKPAALARETPPPSVAARLRSARRAFHTDPELAEALGVDAATLARWRAGEAPGPEERDRIAALDVVVELLSTRLRPSNVPRWLSRVHKRLGNRRPVAVLREGRVSEVLAAVEAEARRTPHAGTSL
ncbi:MAG TPA: hypothetical protein VFX98_05305 [Longimicrobiaceae bacterium]|nr:hypothetical protein [Longimicrobiaceae bacterium]